jgi:hypothetical protein
MAFHCRAVKNSLRGTGMVVAAIFLETFQLYTYILNWPFTTFQKLLFFLAFQVLVDSHTFYEKL